MAQGWVGDKCFVSCRRVWELSWTMRLELVISSLRRRLRITKICNIYLKFDDFICTFPVAFLAWQSKTILAWYFTLTSCHHACLDPSIPAFPKADVAGSQRFAQIASQSSMWKPQPTSNSARPMGIWKIVPRAVLMIIEYTLGKP